MPSLKEYRNRIASVKSTRKITSAMKMVAASKLRRAQLQAEASQPYARRMAEMLARLVSNVDIDHESPVLLAGTGKTDKHLLIVVTSDRGLCGGFNNYIARLARKEIKALEDAGKTVQVLCVGRKGRDALRRELGSKILHTFEGFGRKGVTFEEAQQVTDKVLSMLDQGAFDVCSVVYNEFVSVLTQTPSAQQLVPLSVKDSKEEAAKEEQRALYNFEPDEASILKDLLPRNLSVQIFSALLDSAAGEQAARMTAMENSTRNAGDMIDRMTVTYNRVRQAYITTELIEIIAGAEAV